MDLKFGTSGLRGLATDLTRDVCHLYVGAFLDLLASRSQLHDALCIGRDLRPSSPEIAAWAGAGEEFKRAVWRELPERRRRLNGNIP